MNRFTCPECKGHTWGTFGHWKKDKTQWEGRCRGWRDSVRCTFTWPRTDDEKYGMEPFNASPDISER